MHNYINILFIEALSYEYMKSRQKSYEILVILWA